MTLGFDFATQVLSFLLGGGGNESLLTTDSDFDFDFNPQISNSSNIVSAISVRRFWPFNFPSFFGFRDLLKWASPPIYIYFFSKFGEKWRGGNAHPGEQK